MTEDDDDSDQSSTAETASESDRSVIQECYWVLCGQFIESDSSEDKVKSAFIAIAIATGVLAFAAGTSSFLVDSGNWLLAVGLFVVGVVMLVFAWFIGLNRLDNVLINT